MTVAVLKDVLARPSKSTEEEFGRLLSQAQERTIKRLSRKRSKDESVSKGTVNVPAGLLTEEELRRNRERTRFHLRLSEVAREKSARSATAVFMTLPVPTGETPALLYLAWMDFVSRGMPPFLFVRGSQQSVLTFYS